MNVRYFATKSFLGVAIVFVLLGVVLVIRSLPVNPQLAPPLFLVAPGLVSFSLAVLSVCFALAYLAVERALRRPVSLPLTVAQSIFLLLATYRNGFITDLWWRVLYGQTPAYPRVRPWPVVLSEWAIVLSLLTFVANTVWSARSGTAQT